MMTNFIWFDWSKTSFKSHFPIILANDQIDPKSCHYFLIRFLNFQRVKLALIPTSGPRHLISLKHDEKCVIPLESQGFFVDKFKVLLWLEKD